MTPLLNLYILDYPDAMTSAIHGIEDLFSIANQQAETTLFSTQRLSLSAQRATDQHHIIFIPPRLKREVPQFSDPETLNLLRHWHHAGAILVAACSGVFWLANAGLLDGKQATTHWQLCQHLKDRFPAIDHVSSREMVVDQGDIVTAAGIYAFQDLALHIMARFAGYTLAKKVADFCLLDLSGRLQAYYQRFYPDYSHGDVLILKAQQFCSEHLYSQLSMQQLSEHCHLSQRTLLRRFKRATGFSPKQYLIQLRIEKSKQLMEMKKISIDEISYKLGYTDTSNFIKIFKKVAGVTPSEYRSRHDFN